jgi:shikimate kinase
MNRNTDAILDMNALRQALKKPVMLVGLMGSGKTRLGTKLAHALDLDFHDTDRLIEAKAGYTINEIFEKEGEPKFRAVEKKTVLELLDMGPRIIAGGGGAIMNEGVLDVLKQKAVTVWLKADIGDLAHRLRAAQNRPLLKDRKVEDVLRDMIVRREPFYSQADITVSTTGLMPPEAFAGLIKGLYGFLNPGNV